MTVKDLKRMIRKLPDDMDILVPLNAGEGFDGMFFSPCMEESGEKELGLEDLSDEEIAERELLNQEVPVKLAFVFVPCGFFQEHAGPPVELN